MILYTTYMHADEQDTETWIHTSKGTQKDRNSQKWVFDTSMLNLHIP